MDEEKEEAEPEDKEGAEEKEPEEGGGSDAIAPKSPTRLILLS
ncbi:MAG: hypothetical protein ACM37W_17895 [Actinomycetota bacterium]